MILACPMAGMQEQLLAAAEYEVFAGGAAGPGKSFALLLDGLRGIELAQYRALLLRASYPELQEMMDRADDLFPSLGGTWNENDKRWSFPSGATYELGYLSTWEERKRYIGQEYDWIGYDDITELPDEKTWVFMGTRVRVKDRRSRPRLRLTANPGGRAHVWLKRRYVDTCGENGERVYVDPRNGLPRRFIPGRLADNPALLAANPLYVAQIRANADLTIRQLEHGDWSAGRGTALAELREVPHIVEPFAIPSHWPRWGAFDWGFNHPFAFGLFVRNEDGQVYLVESVHGRLLLDEEIAERILHAMEDLQTGAIHQGDMRPRYCRAGRDCWSDIRARDGGGLSTADTFAKKGLPLMRADDSRINGLRNLRNYIAWHGKGPGSGDGVPLFRIFDTPANRKTFKVLESMVSDPDNVEDVLGQDYDDGSTDAAGENFTGDDAYDMVRYGLMERPLAVRKPAERQRRQPNHDAAFDRMMKRAELAGRPGGRGF